MKRFDTSRRGRHALVAVFAMTSYGASTLAFGMGDSGRGARAFQACMACHSTKAGEHMTGPSLANIWQHKAGTIAGFHRYSEAMKHVELVVRGVARQVAEQPGAIHSRDEHDVHRLAREQGSPGCHRLPQGR